MPGEGCGHLKILNTTQGTYLATRAERAATFWQRGLGLMGRASLPEGYGLIISPCRSIHMFWMRMPIDVCHVDAHDRVVRLLPEIKPWRIGPIVWRGKYVIELPPGTAAKSATKPGDQLLVEP